MNKRERAAAFRELKPTLEGFEQWAELTNNWRVKCYLKYFFACLKSPQEQKDGSNEP